MAILKGRQQAHPDKPFALFLIGMRVNSLLAVHRWGDVARAMTRMQAELAVEPNARLSFRVICSAATHGITMTVASE